MLKPLHCGFGFISVILLFLNGNCKVGSFDLEPGKDLRPGEGRRSQLGQNVNL